MLIPVDSKHPAHVGMFKTLDLLSIETRDDGPIFFIFEGCGKIIDNNSSYFYEEMQCPTNFIRVEAIFTPDNDDPHGLFEFVRSVWMTTDYLEAKKNGCGDEWLRNAFPETIKKESNPPHPGRTTESE